PVAAFISLLFQVRSVSDLTALFSMLNPVMLAVTATVGAAVAVWKAYADRQRRVEETTKNVTEAIRLDSGALGENTREVIKNDLAKRGLIEEAAKFGITADQLVAAVLNEGNARARLQQMLL